MPHPRFHLDPPVHPLPAVHARLLAELQHELAAANAEKEARFSLVGAAGRKAAATTVAKLAAVATAEGEGNVAVEDARGSSAAAAAAAAQGDAEAA